MSPIELPEADVYFGGWHSPKEKEILEWLLKNGRRVIACPAWGIEDSAFAPGVRNALEENRMLILEMRDVSGNLAAAEARNRFVIEHADALFTPHVTPGGMLDRLLKEIPHRAEMAGLGQADPRQTLAVKEGPTVALMTTHQTVRKDSRSCRVPG